MNGGEKFELSEAAKGLLATLKERQKVLGPRLPIKRHLVFNPGVAFCF